MVDFQIWALLLWWIWGWGEGHDTSILYTKAIGALRLGK